MSCGKGRDAQRLARAHPLPPATHLSLESAKRVPVRYEDVMLIGNGVVAESGEVNDGGGTTGGQGGEASLSEEDQADAGRVWPLLVRLTVGDA